MSPRKVVEPPDEQTRILNDIARKINQPSVYMYWNGDMDFGADVGSVQPFSQAKIELYFHNGRYKVSSMFTVLAVAALKCAPADCVGALVNYWSREEVFKSSEKKRVARVIPRYRDIQEVEGELRDLVNGGLLVRYLFKPKEPVIGRESVKEEIFFATGGAIRLARKQVLNFDVGLIDPMDNCGQPDDVFEQCLKAQALAPFLSSPQIKKVSFKHLKKFDQMRCSVDAKICFNKDGINGAFEDDVEVVFQGITFAMNEMVRTTELKESYIIKRIEVISKYISFNEEHICTTYVIFCCEDGGGVMRLSRLINEYVPQLFERALFTTGNVLAKNCALSMPQNIKDCFVKFEHDAKGRYMPTGAVGYSFLESNGTGFGYAL